MKFDRLDSKMRRFETAYDICVPPDYFMVARLDGRGFTRLTKEANDFEVPFDDRFHNFMVDTTQALMTCGFQVLYAHTQSDEISLLLALDEQLFGRKLRKYNSTLAGEASAQFSVRLGKPASFDCRISQLPTSQLVVDYFRWRSEDAARNSLSAWCYWTLRKSGKNTTEATKTLCGLSTAQKNELLFTRGINFNDLPCWQKRGTGLFWALYQKSATNPQDGSSVLTNRKRLIVDRNLPIKEEYSKFLQSRLNAAMQESE